MADVVSLARARRGFVREALLNMLLQQDTPLKMSQIAEIMDRDASQIAHIMKKLADEGFTSRDAAGFWLLTAGGRREAEKCQQDAGAEEPDRRPSEPAEAATTTTRRRRQSGELDIEKMIAGLRKVHGLQRKLERIKAILNEPDEE